MSVEKMGGKMPCENTSEKKELPMLFLEYLHVKMKPQTSPPHESPVTSKLNESEIYFVPVYMYL